MQRARLPRSRSQNALDVEGEGEGDRLALSRRTPTDDEINELWGEVREYLHHNPAGPGGPQRAAGGASEVSAAQSANSALTSASAVRVQSSRSNQKPRTRAPVPAPKQADATSGYVAEFLRAKQPRARPPYLQGPRPQKVTSELLAQFVHQAVAQVYSAREAPVSEQLKALGPGTRRGMPQAALFTPPEVQLQVSVPHVDDSTRAASFGAALEAGAQPLVSEGVHLKFVHRAFWNQRSFSIGNK